MNMFILNTFYHNFIIINHIIQFLLGKEDIEGNNFNILLRKNDSTLKHFIF